MFGFLRDNASTITVGAIVALWLVLAVIKIVRDRKSGKGSCGDCPHRGACRMAGEECKIGKADKN